MGIFVIPLVNKDCFDVRNFRYSAFGAGDTTELRVLVQEIRTSNADDSSGDDSGNGSGGSTQVITFPNLLQHYHYFYLYT